MSRRPWTRWLLAYAYLAPAAAILLTFWILPLFRAFYTSLHAGWGTENERLVWFRNYAELLKSPTGGPGEFVESLTVTAWYVVGTVPIALVLSFLIASLLFQKLRALGLFRTIYFLPYVTSTVAAAMVFRWIFDPGGRGLANTVLGWLGAPGQRWCLESTGVFHLLAEGVGLSLPDWAGGPSLALVCVMIFSIWHVVGFDVVIFLAGLSAIPRELHEAAEVDGAGPWSKMRHITLPLLTPTLFFLAIISVIRSFQTFNQIYVLARDTASTRNVTMLIYSKFWEGNAIEEATAVAVLLFAILLGLTALQMHVLGRRVHY
jgi:multiple sugar transport system permease protein